MTKTNKYTVIVSAAIFTICIVVYIRQKVLSECQQKYTICLINNVKESGTSIFHGDFSIKENKKSRIEKETVLSSIYVKNIGNKLITSSGYYFISYCIDNPELRTIYSNISPLDVDSSFLDSSWNTYKEMAFYTNSKSKRQRIISFMDSLYYNKESISTE